MLDIAFPELMGRTAQQVLAHEPGFSMDERHHVLQLITVNQSLKLRLQHRRGARIRRALRRVQISVVA